jgi:LysR family transcriptional regulator, hydrogen peroxide-inducible genes activator
MRLSYCTVKIGVFVLSRFAKLVSDHMVFWVQVHDTHLRYIVAVARERHFGRAAETCFVSQPTLSVAIKKLEDELGLQLFERGSSDISVTPIGLQVVEQAQKVIEEAQVIKEIARTGKDPLTGPLKVGVIYTIGPYLLPLLVPKMIERHPSTPLMLQENFTVKLLEQLRQGEIDVAILADPFSANGLVTQALYDENFMVAVPKDHHWGKRSALKTEEIKEETMLLLGMGHCFRDHVLEVCPELSRFSASSGGLQKSFEGSSLETIRHMVAAGLGITVLPELSRPAQDSLLTYVPFEPPVPSRRVVLAWRKSFPRAGAIEAMRKVIMGLEVSCLRFWQDARPLSH